MFLGSLSWLVASYGQKTDTCRYDKEKHLANVKMLTFGGENAEAYFSRDDQKLIFQ